MVKTHQLWEQRASRLWPGTLVVFVGLLVRVRDTGTSIDLKPAGPRGAHAHSRINSCCPEESFWKMTDRVCLPDGFSLSMTPAASQGGRGTFQPRFPTAPSPARSDPRKLCLCGPWILHSALCWNTLLPPFSLGENCSGPQMIVVPFLAVVFLLAPLPPSPSELGASSLVTVTAFRLQFG